MDGPYVRSFEEVGYEHRIGDKLQLLEDIVSLDWPNVQAKYSVFSAHVIGFILCRTDAFGRVS